MVLSVGGSRRLATVAKLPDLGLHHARKESCTASVPKRNVVVHGSRMPLRWNAGDIVASVSLLDQTQLLHTWPRLARNSLIWQSE
jgi:hypothetical protein